MEKHLQGLNSRERSGLHPTSPLPFRQSNLGPERTSFDRFGKVAKHWYLFIRMSLNDVTMHLRPRTNAYVLPTARRKSAYFITLSLLEEKKRSWIPRIVFKPASHHVKLLNVSSRPSRIWVPVTPIFRCFWTRYLEWRICNSPRVFVSVSALLLHCFIRNEKTEKADSSQQSSAGGGGGAVTEPTWSRPN